VSRRGWLLFASLSVIWGMPYLLIRVAVAHLNPGTLVSLRTLGAALILLPLAASRGALKPVLARWQPVLLFSVVEVMVPWLLLSDAERRLSSSLAGLLVAIVPLIGAVLGRLDSHGDPMNRRQLCGLAVGLFGVLALVGVDFGRVNVFAVLEVAVVSVGYATGPLVLTRSLSELPGLGVMAVAISMCAAVYLPFLVFAPPRHLRGTAIASIVVLAVVCTALAFLVLFELVAVIGPTRTTLITYVNPAVAVVLGVSVLNEPLTTGILIGFPLILLGSVIAAREPEPVAVA
jgi:drug/metabolite transporter (DMT)-like permease